MQRNCPVCSSSHATLIFHDHNRREGYLELEGDYMMCQQCSMKYLTNIPSFDEMGEKYEDIYVEPDIESILSQIHTGVIKNGKSILDIGCNHGVQLIPYKNAGWDVYGIDLNKRAIEDCRKCFHTDNFSVNTIDEAGFSPSSFDKIQTFHVLEHVYNPKGFLRKCRELLKENGWLEIRIPNGGSLEMKVWGKYSSQSWVPFHINMFDSQTIKKVLDEVGFRNIKINTNPLPWWWILSYRQKIGTINTSRGITNFHQNWFHKGIQVLLYPILYSLSLLGYGEELHIFAKK